MRATLIIISIFLLTCCKTNQLAVVKINNKFGCINRQGEIVIEPNFDWILPGYKSKQILVVKDSLYGFIDKKGKVLIKPQYKDAMNYHEGLASVGNGKKYGFINTKGDTVIQFIYDDVFLGFSNGLSDVTKNDSCGYINKEGEIIIPLIYETCYPFISDLSHVKAFSGEILLINNKGETFIYEKDKYKNKKLWALNTYPGSFIAQTGRGRLNQKGDTIVPPIFNATGNLSDKMYIVQLNGKWGAYNDKGQLVVEPKFDDIGHFKEGVANFKQDGKWGFIDRKGKIIIEPKYEYASQFSSGLAYVEFNGKSGFINKKGKFRIEPTFEIYKPSEFK